MRRNSRTCWILASAIACEVGTMIAWMPNRRAAPAIPISRPARYVIGYEVNLKAPLPALG